MPQVVSWVELISAWSIVAWKHPYPTGCLRDGERNVPS
jgi:hypothetical protein